MEDKILKYKYNGVEIRPSVEVYSDFYAYAAGITIREYFRDKVKCAEAWRAGRKKLTEYFGDLLPLSNISGPGLSYCHAVCLGSQIEYPENAEPNLKQMFSGIDEGIEILKAKKNVNYREQPIFKHYYELCNYLKEQFPDQNVNFSGMGAQGPITSAMLLRGQDFIYDVYDEPEKAKEFLTLLADSIISFFHFLNEVNGKPAISPVKFWLSDDFASLFSPLMWPEFVLPYWNQCFEGLTTGEHWVHCENLAPAHLEYLKPAKLSFYQPSVSDLLTPEIIKSKIDVRFDWLLYSFHISEMSDKQIQEWVDKTVEAGVTSIRTQFGQWVCGSGKLDRIKAFYKAFDKYRVE